MAMRKNERLMNLLIMLLVARRHLDKEHIRAVLYEGSNDEAFEKMFERDKDDLRSLGIPIEIASQDAFFDDVQGYRIHRSAFELPDIELDADEAAVLGLAARVWQHAGLAGATSDAILKLKAAGIAVDRSAIDIVEPQLTAEEPSFDAFWDAAQQRQRVTFTYQRSGAGETSTRTLQPWRVTWSNGRWYVLGYDESRDAARLFRLSRVQGTVVPVGEPGSYDLPSDVDVEAMTRQLAPTSPATEPCTVLARPGSAHGLRRHATAVEEAVTGPTGGVWDRLTLDASLGWLAEEVLSFGADVYAESPPLLREMVVSRLSAVVGGAA
jgi:proteasome accessory factor B